LCNIDVEAHTGQATSATNRIETSTHGGERRNENSRESNSSVQMQLSLHRSIWTIYEALAENGKP